MCKGPWQMGLTKQRMKKKAVAAGVEGQGAVGSSGGFATRWRGDDNREELMSIAVWRTVWKSRMGAGSVRGLLSSFKQEIIRALTGVSVTEGNESITP